MKPGDGVHFGQLRTLLTLSLRMNMRGRAGTSPFGRAISISVSYGIAALYLGWVLSRNFSEPAYVTMCILVTMYLACYTVISSYSMILLDAEERRILALFPISERTLFFSRVANLLLFAIQLGVPFVLPLTLIFLVKEQSVWHGAMFFLVLILSSLWTTGVSLLLYNALISRFANSTRLLAIVQSVLVFLLLFFYQGLPNFSTADTWWNSFIGTRYAIALPTHWFIGMYGWFSGLEIIRHPVYLAEMALLAMAALTGLLRTRWMLLPDLSPGAQSSDTDEDARVTFRTSPLMQMLLRRPPARAGYELFRQLMAKDRNLRFQIIPVIIMPVAVAVYGLLTGGLQSPFPHGLLFHASKVHIPVIVFFLFSARHCDHSVVKAVQASSVWILRFQTQEALHQYARGVRIALNLRVLLPQTLAVWMLFTWVMPLRDAALQTLFLLLAARFQTALLNALRPKIPFFEIETQLATAQRFAVFFIIVPFVMVFIIAHSLTAASPVAFLVMLGAIEALVHLAGALWRRRRYATAAAE
ncbi:MAG: hypothetical protein IPP94_08950 [Ignavibacteria bacterium]|nr:hypothetical protein [Ignavibacteria bacterium]